MRVKIVKTEAARGRSTLGCQASTQSVSALLLAAAALLAACSGESGDTLATTGNGACPVANGNQPGEIHQSFDPRGFMAGITDPSEVADYIGGGTVSPGSGSCPSGQWGFNSFARKTCCSQSPSASEASTDTDSTPPSVEGGVMTLLGFGNGGACLSRSQVSAVIQEAQNRGYRLDSSMAVILEKVRVAASRPRETIPCPAGPSQTSQAAAAASAANEAAIRQSQQRAGRMLEDVGKVTPPTVATPPTTVPNEPTNKDFWTPRIPGQTALPTASGQTNCSGLPSATIKGSSSCPMPSPSTSLTAPQP